MAEESQAGSRGTEKRFYPRPRSSLQIISSNKLLPFTHQLWLTPHVEGESTKNVLTNNTMAECHQHYRFICGNLLQTRRDQRTFNKKTPVVTMPQAPPLSPVDTVPQGGLRHPLQKEKWTSVRWIKNQLNFSFFFVTMAPKFVFIQS